MLPQEREGIAQIPGGGEIPQLFSVQVQGNAGYLQGNLLPVVQLQRQGDPLTGYGTVRVGGKIFDAHVRVIVHPHGSRHGHVPIGLGDSQKIIGESIGKGKRQRPVHRIAGGQHRPAGADDLHQRLRPVRGVVQNDTGFQSLRDAHNGTHEIAVQTVVDVQVRVLGGVDPAFAHGFIEGFLRQLLCQHRCPAQTIGAPIAVVIVLPHSRGHMPAVVQSLNVVGIEGLAALALHLKQLDAGVTAWVVVPEPAEVAEVNAGVVELAYLPRQLCQGGTVPGQRVHAGLIGRQPAVRAKGVDVPHHFVFPPGHLIAEDADKMIVCHSGGSLFARCPFGAVQRTAVVCYGEEVQPLHLRGLGKGLLNRTQSVGQAAVGIQKAKIGVPLPAGLWSGHDSIGIEDVFEQDSIHIRLTLRDSLGTDFHTAPILRQNPRRQGTSPNHDAQRFRRGGKGCFHCGQRPGSLHRHAL